MCTTHAYQQKILTHEADFNGFFRPDAAFRLMQEIAGEHSAKLGFDRDALLKNGRVWMLARAHLQVYAYPKLHDTIHAKSWYGAPGRTTYPRYVEIYDAALQTRLAAFATSWVVVDVATRRIMLPAKAGLLFPPPAEIVPPIQEPGKLRLCKEGRETLFERAPQYSDLDINGHMNNASYVNWILDLFPVAKHRNHRLASLCIGYSAEAQPDELVQMRVFERGAHFDVLGIDKADGHTVFEAQGAWQTA